MARTFRIFLAALAFGSAAPAALPESYHDLPWSTRLGNACLRGLCALSPARAGSYTVHSYQPGDRDLLASAGVVLGGAKVQRALLVSTEKEALRLLRSSKKPAPRAVALLHGRHRMHRSPMFFEAPLTPRTLVRSVHYSTYRLLAGSEGRIDGISFVYWFPTPPSDSVLRDLELRARVVLSWRVAADGEHRPYLLAHGVRALVAVATWPDELVLLFTNRFDERRL